MDNLTLAIGLKSLMGNEKPTEEIVEADTPTTASIVYMVAVTNSSCGEVVLKNEIEPSDEWEEGTYSELSDDGDFEDFDEEDEMEDVDDSAIDLTDGDGINIEYGADTVAFTVSDYQAMATAEYLAELESEEDELPNEEDEVSGDIDDGDAVVLPDVGEDTEDDLAEENTEITDLFDEDYELTDDNEDDESDVVEGAEISDGYTVAECIGTVKAGDRVAVAVQNGRLTVIGVVGSGDETEAILLEASETAGYAYDIASEASENAVDAQNRVEFAEDSIQKLTNAINMLVTDEEGTTLLQQSSEGWSFNFAGVLGSLQENADAILSVGEKIGDVAEGQTISGLIDEINSLAVALQERIAYIDMGTTKDGDPCLELGKRNDKEGFKLLITNKSVDFKFGEQEPIRLENIDGEGWVVADKMIVEEEVHMGKFFWEIKENENISLVWKGGGN